MKIPGLSVIHRIAWAIVISEIVPNRLRPRLLRRLGLSVSTNVMIGADVTFAPPRDVAMGAGTFINREVFIDGVGVSLGRNVYLGPRVMLITAAHPIGSPGLRAAPGAPRPVQIGDGSWLGAGAIILPGVTVGAGCVIAAGAVVTKDCEPNGLYAGVPARRVKELSDS